MERRAYAQQTIGSTPVKNANVTIIVAMHRPIAPNATARTRTTVNRCCQLFQLTVTAVWFSTLSIRHSMVVTTAATTPGPSPPLPTTVVINIVHGHHSDEPRLPSGCPPAIFNNANIQFNVRP
jgi:hypothetical protein